MIKKVAWMVALALSPSVSLCLELKHSVAQDLSKSPKEISQKSVFKVKSGPPAGFELLEKNPHQDTYISIFNNGNFVTNVMADFNDESLKLKNPGMLIDKIPHLNQKKRADLLKVLSQSLPAHPELLCPYGQGRNCHTLSPSIAGFIFDAENYRADLFINPDYLDIIRHDHDALPNSSAGFSFLSRNIFQGTKVQGFKGATWGNTSIVGQGNNELTTNFSYTESWTAPNPLSNISEGTDRTHQFSLNTVTAGRYESGILYQAGMVNNNGGEFFTTPSLGGVNIQNYGVFTANLASEIKGSPLIVYLPMAGTVVVKKQGQILAAVSLPAGKQSLDTSSFPIGSYDVDITITTQGGQVSTQTQFYVKQTTLPDYGRHNFDLAFGVLQKSQYSQTLNQTVTSPSFLNVPIFSYYDMRKLWDKVGLASALMTSGSRTYLSEVFHLYENNFDIAPGAALSSKGDSGIRLGTEYQNSLMNLTLQGFKTWPRQPFLTQDAQNSLGLMNQSSTSFYPLPSSLSQVQANVGFFKWGHQISLGGAWYKSFDGSINKTENLSYSRLLIEGETGNLSLGLSLTHQDQPLEEDTIGLASLTYNFFTAEVNGNAILKFSNPTPDLQGNRSYHPGFMASVGHSAQTDRNHLWEVSGNLDHEVHNQSLGANFNGVSPMVSGNASVTRSLFDAGYGENNTQYTASFQSTVAYAKGHFALGNNQGYQTGIVVKVDSPVDTEFFLYDNDYFVGRFSTNHAHSIFVEPYTVHRFTIQPNTQDIYHFDQNPQEKVLYQGNVEYLHWSLEKQYLLFAKIIHKNGEPLKNYLLNNQGEYDTTDDSGYVQAGLTPSMKTLTFVDIKGDRCVVTLPQNMLQKVSGSVAVVEKPLVCEEEKT